MKSLNKWFDVFALKTIVAYVFSLIIVLAWHTELRAIETCQAQQFSQSDRREESEVLTIYYHGFYPVGPKDGKFDSTSEEDYEKFVQAIHLWGADVIIFSGWNSCDFIFQVFERIPQNKYQAYRVPVAQVGAGEQVIANVNLTILSKVDIVDQDLQKVSPVELFNSPECGWTAQTKIRIGNKNINLVFISPNQNLHTVRPSERDCSSDEENLYLLLRSIEDSLDETDEVVVFSDFSTGTKWNGLETYYVSAEFARNFKRIFQQSQINMKAIELSETHLTDKDSVSENTSSMEKELSQVFAPVFVSSSLKSSVISINQHVFPASLSEGGAKEILYGYGAITSEVHLDTSDWTKLSVIQVVPIVWVILGLAVLLIATFAIAYLRKSRIKNNHL